LSATARVGRAATPAARRQGHDLWKRRRRCTREAPLPTPTTRVTDSRAVTRDWRF